MVCNNRKSCRFLLLQAKIEGKGDALFFVNIDSDGVSMIENPLFSHTFLLTILPTNSKNVFVADKDVIGGIVEWIIVEVGFDTRD